MDALSSTSKALVPRQSISSATNDPANSPSLSQLVSTLVPALAIAGGYMVFFLLLRARIPRAYAPRTFMSTLSPQERSEPLPNGLFNWIIPFCKMSDEVVLDRQSLDGFLLLRYLKISAGLCGFGVLLTWPILMPINATGEGGQVGLNSIAFGNIVHAAKSKYYAHALIACLFFALIFYMVMRESIYYINLRQAYLISPLYANRVSSRTVLFTSVPEDYRNEEVLRRVLGRQVKNIWISRDCDEIEKLVKRREKLAMQLEAAETKLVKIANSARMKAARKQHSEESILNTEDGRVDETASLAARWVLPNERPTHRLNSILGKKVDSINWCRAELEQVLPKVEAAQAKIRQGQGKAVCSVFAEFYSQNEAQAAYQSLIHHQPLQMAPRYIGVNPEQVIWGNLNISGGSSIVRNIIITGIVLVLLLFWAIPVAFIGLLSNISALTKGNPTANPPVEPLLPWLSFINAIPQQVLGVIQGFLPSALLSLLMLLLPPFLRWMARLSGRPTRAAIELYVQDVYFIFQVIQVFLVTTLSSGAAASAAAVANNPTSSASLLASDLPKASNFYVSYIILQGLAVSSAALANVFGVLFYAVCHRLLDSTPRKMYKRFIEFDCLDWGTEYPFYTLLTVIAITYSIIAPLVLGFAAIGLYLIYVAYRYNLLFAMGTDVDTKGLVYARALQHTTTGCYLGTVCLIGLFLVQDAFGPGVIMIIFLVIVSLWHYSLNSAIDPLLSFLPKSLQVEEESLLALENGQPTTESIQESKAPDSNHTTVIETVSPAMSNIRHGGLVRQPTLLKRFTFSQNPTLLTRFLFPNTHCDWHYFRNRLPHTFVVDEDYDPVVERDAYYPPSVTAETPLLWIPRDSMGVSAQECVHTSEIIPMTDEGASFDAKGRVVWNHDADGGTTPPIREKKVYY